MNPTNKQTVEEKEINYCPCGNESPYNPRCDECEAKCRQYEEWD